MQKSGSRNYWDSIAEKMQGGNPGDLWRSHTNGIYQQLIDKWAMNAVCRFSLKTDLYDEAITPHNFFSLLESKSKNVVGTDVSFGVALAARRRLKSEQSSFNKALVSDIRNLAFKSESFDQVISNSTLDHFPEKEDIITGIKEISRILKPGGNLIVSLDNLSNPLIYIRNMLPNDMLNKLGITQFYIGKTVSMAELTNILESNGFEILDRTFIIHSPRVLAVWVGQFIQKTGNERISSYFQRLLKLCEKLERFSTHRLTGHYVAVKALKI